MSDIKESVISYLKMQQEPVSLDELSTMVGVTRKSMLLHLMNWQEEGIVSRVGNNKYSMWCMADDNDGLPVEVYDHLKKYLNQNIANAKGSSEELEKKINEIDEKINSYYVNLMTIMGVFVSVFSLIIVNAQRRTTYL